VNDALLQEILAAYDGDLWPVRGTFLVGCFACPLAALAIHRGVVSKNDPRLELDEDGNPAFAWACDEFGEDWVEGFVTGFDGEERSVDEPAYVAGHECGAMALEQLFPREAPLLAG
jgi:hypothetical protein